MRWSKSIALLAAAMLLTAEGPSNVFVGQSQSGTELLNPAEEMSVQSRTKSRFLPFSRFRVGMTSPGALLMQDSKTPTPDQEPAPSQEQGDPSGGGSSRDGVEGPTPASTRTPQATHSSPSPTPNTPIFFVMIDPAHGGDDRGAVFGANLAEKDITLALARRLKSELQERGISARLLRDGDVSLSLEQRAESANEQHAAAYVALHAGAPGQGVRVYSPALPSVVLPVAGKFPIWDEAQANSLPRSQELAQRITVELDKKVSATHLATPLRPLNNVRAPAVAIELTPDPENLQSLMAQRFQTTVAAGIAAGIAQLRSQLEGER